MKGMFEGIIDYSALKNIYYVSVSTKMGPRESGFTGFTSRSISEMVEL